MIYLYDYLTSTVRMPFGRAYEGSQLDLAFRDAKTRSVGVAPSPSKPKDYRLPLVAAEDVEIPSHRSVFYDGDRFCESGALGDGESLGDWMKADQVIIEMWPSDPSLAGIDRGAIQVGSLRAQAGHVPVLCSLSDATHNAIPGLYSGAALLREGGAGPKAKPLAVYLNGLYLNRVIEPES